MTQRRLRALSILRTVLRGGIILIAGIFIGVVWAHGLGAYALIAGGGGAAFLFAAGIFFGIGWGYGLGHNAGAEEEAAFADPTAFWGEQQEEVALPNGKGHTLDEDLAEWREQVAQAERLRAGARR